MGAAANVHHEVSRSRSRSPHRDKDQDVLEIVTTKRKYVLRTIGHVRRHVWVNAIREARHEEKERIEQKTRSRCQYDLNSNLRRLFHSNTFQAAIVALISINFIFNILDFEFGVTFREVEKEVDGEVEVVVEKVVSGEYFHETVAVLEIVFVCIFTAELLLNFYLHCGLVFFKSSWNVCDLFVVSLSIVGLVTKDLDISFLRMIRAFRVVRVVRRMRSLQTILNSLTNALWPVMSAFALLSIVMALYAVISE